MDKINLLFLGCHSVLEYDEVKLFSELGINVFSMHGAYSNPTMPQDPKRPAINAEVNQHLMDVAAQCSKDNLHPELIEWADVIYVMHKHEWIINNWSNIKKKVVIWRTIGQSVPEIENRLALCRSQGLKIVRYSPMENTIEGYLGHDVIIRFYKDENEFGGYTGEKETVITMAQSMKKRGKYCGYEIFEEATRGFNRIIYGPGNEDIEFNGGCLSYEELQKQYRENRVYFYTGTYPASYTLNFIEAFMTGIPMVCIGNDLANLADYKLDAYEVPSLIQTGTNGYVFNDIDNLHTTTQLLLNDKELCLAIGSLGRKTAIELFGKENIKQQWKEFFESL